MFSYYGSKSKVIDYYPPPKHDLIIEPFAGSARYALKYWDRDVIINEKNPNVYSIWKYLQNCSVRDIKRLPNLPAGTIIEKEMFKCESEYILMSFLIVQGAFSSNKTVSPWGALRFENNRNNILKNLHKIKHWQIIDGDYSGLPNVKATYFIDPPYQFGGHKYPMSNKLIDFDKLRIWCETRIGQTIVCENTKATWMNFKPIKEQWGSMFKTTEAIWSNEITNYDNIQQQLQF